MPNPVSYSDFFSGDDRDIILQAIRDLKDLKASVVEFNNTVTGSHTEKMEQQMAALSKEIQGVAKASRELNVTNLDSQKQLSENLKVIEQLRTENEKLRKSRQGARETEAALAGSVDGLTAKLRDQIKEWRKVDQSTEAGHVNAERLAASIRVTRDEINQLNKQTKDTTSIVRNAAGSYNELDAQTKALVKDLRQMGDIEGANKQKFEALSKQIFDNTAKLKEYDAQVNQNFRNVGNYKSAFNAIGGSINQLTRELPAFTNSVQTGFLAISNNLPIFADALSNAAAKNKELAAAGEKTVPVWKQFTAGLFSWGTALSLGVTLLTVYGKDIVDWIGNLGGAKKKVIELKNATDFLNEGLASSEYKDAIKNVQELTINLELARKGTLDKTYALEQYNKTIGKTTGQVSTLDEAEKALAKNADAYIKMTLYKASANAALAEAAKEAVEAAKLQSVDVDKALDAASKRGPFNLDAFKSGAKGFRDQAVKEKQANAKTFEDIAKDFQTKAAKLAGEFHFDMGGDADKDAAKNKRSAKDRERELEQAIKKQDELIQASAKYRIALAEKAFADSAKTVQDEIALETQRKNIIVETTGLRAKLYKSGSREEKDILAEQLKALAEFQTKRTQILDKDVQARTGLSLKAAEADFNRTKKGWTDEAVFEQKRLEILEAGYNERLTLYSKDSDEYKAILADKVTAEAAAAQKLEQIRKQQEQGRRDVTTSEDVLVNTTISTNIRKDMASGKVTKDDGERQLHLNRLAIIQDEIDAKQKQVDASKEGDADYYAYLKELNGLKKSLVDENADYEIQKAQEVHDAKKELEQAAFDFATETAGTLFDFGRELNQNNLAQLQHDKEQELALAGNNAAARQKIEENYQKEVLKLKRKQAIYDKVQALFNIAISTAQGIAAALANPFTAPFMIPLIIATGALQTAVVLARPLPQYKGGRGRTGRRELAEVNEQGFELIQDASGVYRVANTGRRGVTEIGGGERVYTHAESKQIVHDLVNTEDASAYMASLLKGRGDVLLYQRQREDKLAGAIASGMVTEEGMARAMAKAVGALPLEVWSVDERGARKYIKTMHGRTEEVESRNKLGGNG